MRKMKKLKCDFQDKSCHGRVRADCFSGMPVIACNYHLADGNNLGIAVEVVSGMSGDVLSIVERAIVLRALVDEGYNVSAPARSIGCERKRFERMLTRYKIPFGKDVQKRIRAKVAA